MKKILPFVLMSLKRRKLRNYLTIIGIIIGVVAIVSLISLSEGLKEGISGELSKTGAQKISISSKYSVYGQTSNKGLTFDDVREVEKISGINFATGYLNSRAVSKFNREEKLVNLTAYETKYFSEMLVQDGKELLRGKAIDNEKSKEIVIGYDLYNSSKFYGKIVKIGDVIEIANQKFKVVGILKDTGNQQTDRGILLSFDNLQNIAEVEDKKVDLVIGVVKTNANVEEVALEVENRLKKIRKDDDFSVSTPLKEAENREKTLRAVSIVVVGIAAISLLVGGIGILNSMYTSVLERRKEIGILKAVGARKEDILKIFLLEAGIIGLIGGFIGVAGGFLIAFIVNIIGKFAGIHIAASYDITILLIALGFSFILGLIAGFFPAYQASNQQAIDSLRSE